MRILYRIFISIFILPLIWYSFDKERFTDRTPIDERGNSLSIEEYRQNALSISEREGFTLASGLSFNLFPINAAPTNPSFLYQPDNIHDFLFVDYEKKEIGIHLTYFMPNTYYVDRKERGEHYGIPYKNMYPALKYLYIQDEESIQFPEKYELWTISPDKKEYYQEMIGSEIVPFYYQPIVEADFDTFVLWTGGVYAADKNNVYVLLRQDIPLKEDGLLNYEILKKGETVYYPFYNIVEGADPLLGNLSTIPEYLIQDTGVWYRGVKLEGANPNQPNRLTSSVFFVQKEGVWYLDKKLPADPNTFLPIREPVSQQELLAVDKDNFYIQEKVVSSKEDLVNVPQYYAPVLDQMRDNPIYSGNILFQMLQS